MGALGYFATGGGGGGVRIILGLLVLLRHSGYFGYSFSACCILVVLYVM